MVSPKRSEMIRILRHKSRDEIYFFIVFFAAAITLVLLLYNAYAAFDPSSKKNSKKYIETQKFTATIALVAFIIGIGVLTYAYFRIEGKMGSLRALFSEEELPTW